jgi:hypothetical protein
MSAATPRCSSHLRDNPRATRRHPVQSSPLVMTVLLSVTHLIGAVRAPATGTAGESQGGENVATRGRLRRVVGSLLVASV